ncbi:MAG: hypothetical protein K0Q57_1174 [Gammaproteobacteria bacterium]|jgi:hypothetical protein|nr:hypothetical protein [Gammaproteobacteria bacterium]
MFRQEPPRKETALSGDYYAAEIPFNEVEGRNDTVYGEVTFSDLLPDLAYRKESCCSCFFAPSLKSTLQPYESKRLEQLSREKLMELYKSLLRVAPQDELFYKAMEVVVVELRSASEPREIAKFLNSLARTPEQKEAAKREWVSYFPKNLQESEREELEKFGKSLNR